MINQMLKSVPYAWLVWFTRSFHLLLRDAHDDVAPTSFLQFCTEQAAAAFRAVSA